VRERISQDAQATADMSYSQSVTFHFIKLMRHAQELTMTQHQPTYLFVNVRPSAVLRAQLSQLHQQYTTTIQLEPRRFSFLLKLNNCYQVSKDKHAVILNMSVL